MVLSTSPTLVTPNLGVASCTSLVSTSFIGAQGTLSESNVTAGAYIGMSGPNAKMELVSSGTANLGFIDFTTASPSPDYNGRIIYSHTASTMTFETGAASRVVLSNTSLIASTFIGATGLVPASTSTAGVYMGRSSSTPSNSVVEIVATNATSSSYIDFCTASPSTDFDGQISYNHTNSRFNFSTGGLLQMTLTGALLDVTPEIRATEIEILKSSVPRLDINPTSGTGSTSLATATAVNNFITGVKVGDSVLYSQRDLIFGNSNSSLYSTTVYGVLNTTSFIRSVPSMTFFDSPFNGPGGYDASSGIKISNYTVTVTSGETLTYGTTDFTNNLGRTVAVTVSYSVRLSNLGNSGFMESYIQRNGGGSRVGYSQVTMGDYTTGTSSLFLANGESFSVWVFSSSISTSIQEYFKMTYVIH
jgi:hypothetical protein